MGEASRPTGVLLMTFGAAASPEDVPVYLASVRGGQPPPEALVAEFQRRYRVTGGSPLVRITAEQAAALERLLNMEGAEARRYRVLPAMRHTPPFIADALARLAAEGARQAIAVIMAPQHSPLIMAGYHRAVQDALPRLPREMRVSVAGAWHTVPALLESLAQRTREALGGLPLAERDTAPVLFTAHSVPKSVVDREPEYLQMLRDTAQEVQRRLGLAPARCQFAYQSAGHRPEEWLKPDIKDLFPTLRAAGHRSVLIAPVQFVADHLEVLYDIDVEARQQAERARLALHRIQMPNTMPLFIRALAEVVRRELVATGA